MGTTKVLIVEDEPNMVAGLRDNFEYEGFQVITALDGVEGLERALKDSPDLIVLDVMMPRMSGLDVCKQLKAKRPSIPISMLTARGQEVDKAMSKSTCAVTRFCALAGLWNSRARSLSC